MCSDEDRWLSRIENVSSSAGTALGELSCSASDSSSPSMLQKLCKMFTWNIKKLHPWLCPHGTAHFGWSALRCATGLLQAGRWAVSHLSA